MHRPLQRFDEALGLPAPHLPAVPLDRSPSFLELRLLRHCLGPVSRVAPLPRSLGASAGGFPSRLESRTFLRCQIPPAQVSPRRIPGSRRSASGLPRCLDPPALPAADLQVSLNRVSATAGDGVAGFPASRILRLCCCCVLRVSPSSCGNNRANDDSRFYELCILGSSRG
jgi:hypothetical protein